MEVDQKVNEMYQHLRERRDYFLHKIQEGINNGMQDSKVMEDLRGGLWDGYFTGVPFFIFNDIWNYL